MKNEVNKIFQDYLAAHEENKSINFDGLLQDHPKYKDQLAKKIEAYKVICNTLNHTKSADEPALIGKEVGNCKIKELIKSGGMSWVYLADQKSLNREVAIKVLKEIVLQSESSIGRFRRESQNIAKLDHPNILPVYDVGTDSGIQYVITKYIKGVSCEDIVKFYRELGEKPSLSDLSQLLNCDIEKLKQKYDDYEDFVCTVILDVAKALEFSHSHGIIHRDVKPSNILITPEGDPVLIDFGLSRDFTQQSITISGEYLGTPVYSSPEQLFGDQNEVDEQSDIYSLGVTFYEMLTSELPFEGKNFLDIITNIKTNPPKLKSDIEADIKSIILSCIEKDKKKRFKTTVTLIASLQDLFSEQLGNDFSQNVKINNRRKYKIGKKLIIFLCVFLVLIGAYYFRPMPNDTFKDYSKLESQAYFFDTLKKFDLANDFKLPIEYQKTSYIPGYGLLIYLKFNDNCRQCKNTADLQYMIGSAITLPAFAAHADVPSVPNDEKITVYLDMGDYIRFSEFDKSDLNKFVESREEGKSPNEYFTPESKKSFFYKNNNSYQNLKQVADTLTGKDDSAKSFRESFGFTLQDFKKYGGQSIPIYIPNTLSYVLVDLPAAVDHPMGYLPIITILTGMQCNMMASIMPKSANIITKSSLNNYNSNISIMIKAKDCNWYDSEGKAIKSAMYETVEKNVYIGGKHVTKERLDKNNEPSLYGIRIGDTPDILSTIGYEPINQEELGNKMSLRFMLNDGNMLSVTYDKNSNKIIYIELSWDFKSDSYVPEASGLKFGKTTLTDILEFKGGTGHIYEQSPAGKNENGDLILLNSYNVENSETIMTFATKLSKDVISKYLDQPNIETIANAKLIGVILGDKNYIESLWGQKMFQ